MKNKWVKLYSAREIDPKDDRSFVVAEAIDELEIALDKATQRIQELENEIKKFKGVQMIKPPKGDGA